MSAAPPAGLGVRLLAALYDLLVCAALWMGTGFAVLPFTGGEAVPAGTPWFRALLFAVTVAYFGLSWRHGGRTIGGRAWRLRVVGADGSVPSWTVIARRLGACVVAWACAGLGFLWIAVDRERRAWQDLAAGTRVLRDLQPARRK
jgi:uncharacterized RDD family membrane protein YckC